MSHQHIKRRRKSLVYDDLCRIVGFTGLRSTIIGRPYYGVTPGQHISVPPPHVSSHIVAVRSVVVLKPGTTKSTLFRGPIFQSISDPVAYMKTPKSFLSPSRERQHHPTRTDKTGKDRVTTIKQNKNDAAFINAEDAI